MQKKNLSLIAFILLIVFVVFSFMPVILKTTSWEEIRYGHYTERWSALESFAYNAYLGSFTGIIACLCYVFAIVGIITLILQFVGKTSKRIDNLTYSPIVAFILFVIFSLLHMLPREIPGSYSPYGYLGASPGWGYYIEIALILAVAVMSVLIATGKVKNIPVTTTKPIANNDETEILQRYKKLLDDGVINQEEFDAKKKQLLEL